MRASTSAIARALRLGLAAEHGAAQKVRLERELLLLSGASSLWRGVLWGASSPSQRQPTSIWGGPAHPARFLSCCVVSACSSGVANKSRCSIW